MGLKEIDAKRLGVTMITDAESLKLSINIPLLFMGSDAEQNEHT